jgi:hypothetical protein
MLKGTAMKFSWPNACVFSTLCVFLSACGGGGSSAPSAPVGGVTSPTPTPVPNNGTSSITGIVVSSDTGLPLGNVKVSLDAASTQTAADGTYTLQGLTAAPDKIVRFEISGYAMNLAQISLLQNQTTQANTRLTPVGITTTLPVATGGTVTVSNSPAAVVLPAAGLIDTNGVLASGAVTVDLTPVNPAEDPANMPGSLATVQEGVALPIESFGAIQVSLKDAQGQKLQLAPGKTATVRIPAVSRTSNLPSDIPLYFLDETTGKWVQEGSASLKRDATGSYYEGTVTHFSTWNADRIYETTVVQGCLVDATGARAPFKFIASAGIDYSGSAQAYTDAEGNFSVPVRRYSTAVISAELPGNTYVSTIVQVENSSIKLPECLKASASANVPAIVSQPLNSSVPAQRTASFIVLASGNNLRFQWQRNGVDIVGATTPTLTFTAQVDDDGARYTAVVSNSSGSVISTPAVLKVLPVGVPLVRIATPWPRVPIGLPAVFVTPINLFFDSDVTFQWQRNGVNIPNANGYIYFTPAVTAADDGAVFTVTATNSAGSASDSIVLRVANEIKFDLLALPYASLGYTNTGNIDLLTETLLEDRLAGNPADLCSSGSATATLNGSPLVAGQTLPTSGTLSVTYANCVDASLTDGTTYDGSVALTYSVNNTQQTATYVTTQLRTVQPAATGNTTPASDITQTGEFSLTSNRETTGKIEKSNLIYNAKAGLRRVNNITGKIVTHESGASELSFTDDLSAGPDQPKRVFSKETFKNLTFSFDGASYGVNGNISTRYGGATSATIEAFGEHLITKNGAPLGRLYGSTALLPLPFTTLTEAFGEVPTPFMNAGTPLNKSMAARSPFKRRL